jgi:chloride channel 2
VAYIWGKTFGKMGEDWLFLAVLGVIMSFVSYTMDYAIDTLNHSRFWLYQQLGDAVILSYLAWSALPTFLILFSAGIIHLVAPTAAGSGIPELKTIFRGVMLKDFLSGKTLIAKSIGLMCTLGAGMPLGKEGPFVHIASIVATGLSNLITSFKGTYANESKSSEMLAAACAVGVACCFASPIGGVLFSIEVTAAFFAVRNYWRGFFASVCGALVFRLISVWLGEIDTIVAVFQTGFDVSFPFDPVEIYMFAFIGALCGLGGAFYVYAHRRYVLWLRGNKRLQSILSKNRFIYPCMIAWLISSLSFPPWFGQFYASDIGTHDQIHVLFSNYSWTREPTSMTVDEWDHVKHFVTPYSGIFVNLLIFMFMTFVMSILASTMPVPTGALIPAFKIGAGLGRICGEAMHVWFGSKIIPGGYATVGAAAFTGAVTHTLSISVIVFEMTGQITHCLPMLISVLIANAFASLLSPSCYDSVIMLKKLPYLPDILPSSSNAYDLYVKDFMMSDVKCIWHGMTYSQLREMLKEYMSLNGFPLVDSPDQMILLGSVKRGELISAIEDQISRHRRLAVVAERRRQEDMKRLEREQQELTEQLEKMETKKAPSRFEVTIAKEDGSMFAPPADTIMEDEEDGCDGSDVGVDGQHKQGDKKMLGLKKQILHSMSLTQDSGSHRTRNPSGGTSPYQTVTGMEKLTNIFRRPRSGTSISQASLGSASSPSSPPPGKSKVEFILDMPLMEQQKWETEQMEQEVDFDSIQVRDSPKLLKVAAWQWRVFISSRQ